MSDTWRPESPPDVPVAAVGLNMLGDPSLRSPEGRGIVNGVPYGDQLDTEAKEVAAVWGLWPAAHARLRAATRSALRR